MVRDKYGPLFNDPSRIPTFDEKTGLWELSKKFNVEENDEPDYSLESNFKKKLEYLQRGNEQEDDDEEESILEKLEKGKLHHPFLDKIL
jgi:hypothetical protein